MIAINSNRSMTLLNSLGDVTLVWTKEKDEEVKAMIRDKIAHGIRFFIIKPVPLTPLFRRANVKDPNVVKNQRIGLKDAELGKLIAAGNVELMKVGTNTMEFVKATKDVDEIATSNTVATRQLVGG